MLRTSTGMLELPHSVNSLASLVWSITNSMRMGIRLNGKSRLASTGWSSSST
jgi:hypothetical protein